MISAFLLKKAESQGGKWQLGLWHRQENYNLPGYSIDANSYLRLNEALDTPRQSTFPSTSYLQGTLPRTLQVLQMIAANLWYNFSNSLSYWKCKKKKTNKRKNKSCSFAQSPRRWGKEKNEVQFCKGLAFSVQKRCKDPNSVHTLLRHFH